MGILKYYRYVNSYTVDFQEHKPYVQDAVKKQKYVIPEVIPVTLADQDSRSENYITAHDLRDYRRTEFNLVLLPSVSLPYDFIAEEVYGLNVSL